MTASIGDVRKSDVSANLHVRTREIGAGGQNGRMSGVSGVFRVRTRWAALAAALLTPVAPAGATATAPARILSLTRILSLNSCTDAILVELVGPTRIAGLSHWSRDPHGSTIAELARRLPITYGSAEEVVALRPDLVLTGQFGSPPLDGTLRRLGIPVLRTRTPFTVAESEAQIRMVAARVGASARGEALVRRIDAALGAAAPPPGSRPVTALVLNPGGTTLGPRTLTGELMRRAGLENIAARYGAGDWGEVRLEQLIADPPRLLLTSPRGPGAPGWNERILSHPALRAIRARMVQAPLPERLLFCGGPAIVPALQALSSARKAVEVR